MRTALCISGHLRSFLDVYQYIKDQIIDPMNCEIFIHTWSTLGGELGRKKGDGDSASHKVDIDRVYELAKPVSLIVESEDTKLKFIDATRHIVVPIEEQKFIAGRISNHVGMFYSIYKANQLKCDFEKLNHFKYDRVIRFRGDIRMGTTFSHDMFPDNDVLYVPAIGQYAEDGINDQVAISSSHVMDVYCEAYYEIIKYYESGIVVRRPEAILKHFLDSKNIKTKQEDITYDIYRLDNSILRQYKYHGDILGVKWR